MVVEPAFTYFFTLWEGIGAKILWSISFLPSLENLVNKINVQNVIFVLFKTFSHLTGHLNFCLLFIFLQIGCSGGGGGG